MRTIAFFNNKGGVGKTTVLYHLAWMYNLLGLRVIAADLDPQSNLSSMFLTNDRLEEIWNRDNDDLSIVAAMQPLIDGTGDIAHPHIETIDANLGLLVGNLSLARVEDELSAQWPLCLDRKTRAFRVISGFHRAIGLAARSFRADLALIDVGPNLGAINRSAIISADHIAVPLVPDLFSLQGLRNLGPTLRSWREGWQERLAKRPLDIQLDLPSGTMTPAGYIVMQHAVRQDRPVRAYDIWMRRIPQEYRVSVLDQSFHGEQPAQRDPYCLSLLKHYRSLMPMAMEAGKPMFLLKPADGAIGSHVAAVQDCYHDFLQLANSLARVCGVMIPSAQPSLFK